MNSEAKKKKLITDGMDKTNASHLRLLKDAQEINLPENCVLNFPDVDDLTKFKLKITPTEGYYKDATYQFSFLVGPNYPFEPPKVRCETKIFHPNIDVEGRICLNILREDWTPVLSLNSIAYGLIYLLNEPNAEDALNREAADLLKRSPVLFQHKVMLLKSGLALPTGSKRKMETK